MEIWKAINSTGDRGKLTQIADYVGSNEALFKQLVDIYLAGPFRITHRAAIPIEACLAQNELLIRPYLTRLISALDTPGTTNAFKRNTIRMFQNISIPRRVQGRVLDICFRFLQDKHEPIAVKVFSMTVISKLSVDKPELQRELKLILEAQLPYAGPAFRSRAARVFKDLERVT